MYRVKKKEQYKKIWVLQRRTLFFFWVTVGEGTFSACVKLKNKLELDDFTIID